MTVFFFFFLTDFIPWRYLEGNGSHEVISFIMYNYAKVFVYKQGMRQSQYTVVTRRYC